MNSELKYETCKLIRLLIEASESKYINTFMHCSQTYYFHREISSKIFFFEWSFTHMWLSSPWSCRFTRSPTHIFINILYKPVIMRFSNIIRGRSQTSHTSVDSESTYWADINIMLILDAKPCLFVCVPKSNIFQWDTVTDWFTSWDGFLFLILTLKEILNWKHIRESTALFFYQ